MKEAGINLAKCYVVPLVNDENNARWVGHLKSFLPRFDVAYTGNPYVAILMQKSGIKVSGISFYNKEKCNGSRIRQLISRGNDWESLVPNEVAKAIKKSGWGAEDQSYLTIGYQASGVVNVRSNRACPLCPDCGSKIQSDWE